MKTEALERWKVRSPPDLQGLAMRRKSRRGRSGGACVRAGGSSRGNPRRQRFRGLYGAHSEGSIPRSSPKRGISGGRGPEPSSTRATRS